MIYAEFNLYCPPKYSNTCNLSLYHTIPTFNNPDKEALFKILWEKEKMLVTYQKHKSLFELHLKYRLQIYALKLDWSRILSFGKEI